MLNLNPKEIDYHKPEVSKWFWAFVITCCISLIIIGVLKVNNHNLKVRLNLQDETIQGKYAEIEQLEIINSDLSKQKLFWQNRCLEIGGQLKELPGK